jgi:CDGSH-type Zn-finger protein
VLHELKLEKTAIIGHKCLISFLNIKGMASTKIIVNDNGSLKISGDFEIVDKTGALYDLGGREIISLCRCGKSATKPFCDGSHKNHFEHNAVAFALPPKKVI